MMALALPLSLFLTNLPDRDRCEGSPLETGAPISSPLGGTTYVESIAQIDDAASGNIRGWAYLTRGAKGETLYVQLRRPADDDTLARANLRWQSNDTITSVTMLGPRWPWPNLRATKCDAISESAR